ncbi:MAG: SMP-30/gluconolactonase/LRE family protein [Bacteroidales bacterium]|nr:SMP-30/gluconolactonase/LRE family protein [Bacteroidales bacterium]
MVLRWYKNVLYRYTYTKGCTIRLFSGKISNPKDIIIIPKELGSPDGSTIDANGNLWIAMWNGGCVTCWNPNTGALLDKIEVPAWNITSVAFGGSQLDELYITSSRLWMPEGYDSKFIHAGSVFSCKPGVKGVKAMYFSK